MTIEMPAAEAHMRRDDAKRLMVLVTIPAGREAEALALAECVNARKIHQLYVKLGLPRKPRTTGYRSQNHRIHGNATQIAEYVGESKSKIISDAVDIAMGMHPDFPTYTDWKGRVMPVSESEWSTVEAAAVCKAFELIASTIGIELTEYQEATGEETTE